jgi:hypothetical protein
LRRKVDLPGSIWCRTLKRHLETFNNAR